MMLEVLAQTTADAGSDGGYLVWGFALLGITILLIVVEFAVPSGGLIALVSGVTCIGSLVAFFMYDSTVGAIAFAAYILLGPILIIYGFRIWLSSSLAERMILGGTKDDADENGVPDELERRHAARVLAQELIGAEGRTATALRPVGVVVIDGRRIDALAESGTIESDVAVEVTQVYDNQIKVRPLRT